MNWNFIWILIPLAALSIPVIAIIASLIEKILKSQERQANVMTEEFMAEITAQLTTSEEERKQLQQRIVNLEAIVSASAEQNDQKRALPISEQDYLMPDLQRLNDRNDAEKVANMAKKLQK